MARSSRSASTCSVEEADRCLLAQLRVVNYLHHFLTLYPCVYLTRKLKPKFIHVYLKYRTRYLTFRLLGAAVLWTMVLPCFFAKVFMNQDCDSHIEKVHLLNFTLEGHGDASIRREDPVCKSVRFLRSPGPMALLGVPAMCLILVLWALIHCVISARRMLLDKFAFTFGNAFLPNVMMNGFGPRGTDHSLRKTMDWVNAKAEHLHSDKKKATEGISWMHDFFAPFDIIVFSALLCAVLALGFTVAGAFVGGAAGLVAGASLGAASGRLTLTALNFLFGASDDLAAVIREELAAFQPIKYVTTNDGQVVDSQLEKKVRSAADTFTKYADGILDRSKIDRPTIDEVAGRIRSEGKEVLEKIILWYISGAGTDKTGQVRGLFKAKGKCFTATEYDLVALSTLDMELFLLAYFDPNEKFLPHFPVNLGKHSSRSLQLIKGETWGQDFRLKEVYLSWPELKLCRRDTNVKMGWRVLQVDMDGCEVDHTESSQVADLKAPLLP